MRRASKVSHPGPRTVLMPMFSETMTSNHHLSFNQSYLAETDVHFYPLHNKICFNHCQTMCYHLIQCNHLILYNNLLRLEMLRHKFMLNQLNGKKSNKQLQLGIQQDIVDFKELEHSSTPLSEDLVRSHNPMEIPALSLKCHLNNCKLVLQCLPISWLHLF